MVSLHSFLGNFGTSEFRCDPISYPIWQRYVVLSKKTFLCGVILVKFAEDLHADQNEVRTN
jgi:hypothetical protein